MDTSRESVRLRAFGTIESDCIQRELVEWNVSNSACGQQPSSHQKWLLFFHFTRTGISAPNILLFNFILLFTPYNFMFQRG